MLNSICNIRNKKFIIFFLIIAAVLLYHYPRNPNFILEQPHNHTRTINGTEITKLNLHEFPYFDALKYKPGELELLKKDYIKFHSLMMDGKIPLRIIVMDSHTGVGWGNRMEQLQFAMLYGVLMSRAIISEFIHPYNFSDYFTPEMNYMNTPKRQAMMSTLQNVTYFDDMNSFAPNITNASLVDIAGEYQAIVFTSFRSISFPPEIYRHPLYSSFIPLVLKNWKEPITDLVIGKPKQRLVKEVQRLRTNHWGYNAGKMERMYDCALEYAKNKSRPAFYVSADQTYLRYNATQWFGDRTFDSEYEAAHVAEGGLTEFGLLGAILDWYLIGEGDIKIVSWFSSFGGTAADRTSSERYVIGYITQCTNPGGEGYMERMYLPVDVQYQQKGYITFSYDVSKK